MIEEWEAEQYEVDIYRDGDNEQDPAEVDDDDYLVPDMDQEDYITFNGGQD